MNELDPTAIATIISSPAPTGWPNRSSSRGISRARARASSRAASHSSPSPSAPRPAASASPGATPAVAIASVAATSIASGRSGTTRGPREVRGSPRRKMAAVAASTPACPANAQNAPRHSPAVANSPPTSGPHSAETPQIAETIAISRVQNRSGNIACAAT